MQLKNNTFANLKFEIFIMETQNIVFEEGA